MFTACDSDDNNLLCYGTHTDIEGDVTAFGACLLYTSLLPDNEGAYELSLDIMAEKAEIIGFSLFNDKGEKVDIYFNLPERKLVMAVSYTHLQ